jgi:hypothetical protein
MLLGDVHPREKHSCRCGYQATLWVIVPVYVPLTAPAPGVTETVGFHETLVALALATALQEKAVVGLLSATEAEMSG